MNYKDSGVDIQLAEEFVDKIKSIRKSQLKYSVNIESGYGSAFVIPNTFYDPVVVSSCDGVGTKVKLALQARNVNTALYNIGIDLVAMCVNDLLCVGARPMHFLDYYSTSKLDANQGLSLINGIIEGCSIAGCELSGGETAEMPGVYQNKDFDIAGFAVGIAERNFIFEPSKVREGDILLGIPSNGFHSNGFSLIRSILENNPEYMEDVELMDKIMTPTRIYVNDILPLLSKTQPILPIISGIAHITGGGLTKNVPRILPKDLKAVINTSTWEFPKEFVYLFCRDEFGLGDLYSTFNCGIGMVMSVAPHSLNIVREKIKDIIQIGTVEKRFDGEESIIMV